VTSSIAASGAVTMGSPSHQDQSLIHRALRTHRASEWQAFDDFKKFVIAFGRAGHQGSRRVSHRRKQSTSVSNPGENLIEAVIDAWIGHFMSASDFKNRMQDSIATRALDRHTEARAGSLHRRIMMAAPEFERIAPALGAARFMRSTRDATNR
jgi:hypothetical protein